MTQLNYPSCICLLSPYSVPFPQTPVSTLRPGFQDLQRDVGTLCTALCGADGKSMTEIEGWAKRHDSHICLVDTEASTPVCICNTTVRREIIIICHSQSAVTAWFIFSVTSLVSLSLCLSNLVLIFFFFGPYLFSSLEYDPYVLSSPFLPSFLHAPCAALTPFHPSLAGTLSHHLQILTYKRSWGDCFSFFLFLTVWLNLLQIQRAHCLTKASRQHLVVIENRRLGCKQKCVCVCVCLCGGSAGQWQI